MASTFTTCFGQISSDFNLEAFAEKLFATQEEDLDYETLYENLLQLYLSPIDINRCSADDLQSLYILTPLQINRFMEYRGLYGNFLSVYELQAVPNFDIATIKKLLPFITINVPLQRFQEALPLRALGEKSAYLIYRIRSNLETRKGFTPPDTLSNGRLTSRYIGSQGAQYLRFRSHHSKDFSIGLTMDKDSGESLSWNPSQGKFGADFLSYHISLMQKGNWKIITLGDYQAQFGQGLVFGAGFSVGKGAETITTIRRSSTGIKPYTSSMENGFFRGLAATYRKGNMEGSILYSQVPRDASLEATDSLQTSSLVIRSLPESGYHRTNSEISNRAAVTEQGLGANLAYFSTDKNLQIGLNSLLSKFEHPYRRNDQIYNQYEFRGQLNHVHSSYISFNHQNHFFFGEMAISKSTGKAFVIGAMSSLSQDLDLAVHIRDYDRNFHSFYGNAFSEGSRPINEKGIYLAINYRPNRQWRWSGYFDHFKFPWLRYRVYSPSSGHEWLQRITYSPKKSLSFYLQIREEIKDRNISSTQNENPTYQLSTGTRRNYTLNLDYSMTKYFSIRTRIQTSSFEFDHQKTRGYAIAQDANLAKGKWKWSTRFALFDTEDYENRQYIFEKNVLWAFSIPSYYGQGMRYYLLTQYNLSRKLSFWIRWSRSVYTDRDQIGSGLQQVDGNRLSELTAQMRYQFNK
ncbi:helix-hairpin-helix domain-containing protein [Echinicola sediminis]